MFFQNYQKTSAPRPRRAGARGVQQILCHGPVAVSHPSLLWQHHFREPDYIRFASTFLSTVLRMGVCAPIMWHVASLQIVCGSCVRKSRVHWARCPHFAFGARDSGMLLRSLVVDGNFVTLRTGSAAGIALWFGDPFASCTGKAGQAHAEDIVLPTSPGGPPARWQQAGAFFGVLMLSDLISINLLSEF